jgi:hypothetical protein
MKSKLPRRHFAVKRYCGAGENGIPECWNTGMMEYWNDGIMK